MDYGFFLQILFVIAGVLIFITEIVLLAKRKLSESTSLTWGFVAIVFIIAGIVLRPTGWIKYMSVAGMILLCLVGLCLVYGLIVISCHISELSRKETEMAMNISLLNQEILELKKNISEKEKELAKYTAEKTEENGDK